MTTEEQPNSKSSDDDMEVDGAQDAGGESDEEGGWRVSDEIYIPPPPMIFGEYDTKGPRLMIVKIMAKNFKSYAGTIEIGPFHKVCLPNTHYVYKFAFNLLLKQLLI